MSMVVRYSGGFHSRDGAIWRCNILQESDVVLSVGQLTYPSDEPLLIEWNDTSKEEPVCGSTATLTIVSPGDRTYLDLYTIKPAQIRLDVYRNNILYWSGCLDPEFYEEPYYSDNDYEVSLTFSDFGIMDRIPYDMKGLNTVRAIIENALNASKINYGSINEQYISTVFEDDAPMTLASISIPSENFVDEDGEIASFYDVVKGILKPLGLRIIQRSGIIYVYDINGLCTKKTDTRRIKWSGEDSVLGTDNVYNNIKITFSPYSSATMQNGELEYGDTFGPEWVNLASDSGYVKYYAGTPPEGMKVPECYSYYLDYDESHRTTQGWDYDFVDFTIFRSYDSRLCKGLEEIGSHNAYFKIQPMLGAEEREGVIGGFYTGGHGPLTSGWSKLKGISPENHQERLVMRTTRSYLPRISSNECQGNYIKIELPLLFDPRYNPYEDASASNEQGNYDEVKSYGQFAFVPVAIVLYDVNGNALWHYNNRWLTENGHAANSVKSTAQDSYLNKWGWQTGEAQWGEAWLSYYDCDALIEGTGLTGWSSNRQNFGKPWTDGSKKVSKRKLFYKDKYSEQDKDFFMFNSFKRMPSGQFIPYPPEGGYLEIRIYNGVWVFDDTERFTDNVGLTLFSNRGLYTKIRWQLYGLPKASVVRATLTFDESKVEDVEYTGVVNEDAKEPLEFDTICGTIEGISPTARGIYQRAYDGLQIQKLKRAGRVEHPEQLLIGTLYSQYAERHATLSGEVETDTAGLTLYVEAGQGPDKKFIVKAEEQDIKAGYSEITYVEVSPDEYTDKEQ